MKTSTPSFNCPTNPNISAEEYQLIQQLRERNPAQQMIHRPPNFGERLSDRVVEIVGSWKFIAIQSVLLVIWIVLNVLGTLQRWDPYPFILLNLMLSFQAAYTAPVIMMSQNRQSQIDRQDAKYDYEVNLKSELEIELLHDQINLLREEELSQITDILKTHQQSFELINLLKYQQLQIDRLEQKLDSLLAKKLN
jgi:uncharacterized membrane protein